MMDKTKKLCHNTEWEQKKIPGIRREIPALKRLLAAALLLMTLPLFAWAESGLAGAKAKKSAASDRAAESAQSAQYEAYVTKEVFLRVKPRGERILKLSKNTKILVLEWGKNWCRILSRNDSGYVETKKLARFRSLDPMQYPVPGRTVNVGIVTLDESATIKGGRFTGMKAAAGTVVCVTEAGEEAYRLAVWRGSGKIAKTKGAFQPFIAWEEAQPGDLIGGFTTFYNGQMYRFRNKERTYNITLACKRINGAKVKAGKRFSFNKKCAPYSQGNKYQLAPNISARGVGYGGGVCQLSTTLYNALLALPIQVEQVKVHRENGVKYIPQWFDAAVGTYSDLAFTNTLPYPIRLSAKPQGGALTVLIYRADEPAAQTTD